MKEARAYLDFSCRLYSIQNAAKRVFIHEHPAHAASWEEGCIQELLKQVGVQRVELDMCRFNLQTQDPNGEWGLVKKSTSLLTNSDIVAEHLSRKCCGGHKHNLLIGGRRATLAATYTPEFCEAIVEAFKKHVKH